MSLTIPGAPWEYQTAYTIVLAAPSDSVQLPLAYAPPPSSFSTGTATQNQRCAQHNHQQLRRQNGAYHQSGSESHKSNPRAAAALPSPHLAAPSLCLFQHMRKRKKRDENCRIQTSLERYSSNVPEANRRMQPFAAVLLTHRGSDGCKQ